jgi:hypothetical protein
LAFCFPKIYRWDNALVVIHMSILYLLSGPVGLKILCGWLAPPATFYQPSGLRVSTSLGLADARPPATLSWMSCH